MIEALNHQAAKRPRWGFWKCYDRMRIEGCPWNHKRVHRVDCAMQLDLPRRTKRRVPTRDSLPLEAPSALNRVWSLDFMHDAPYDGRPLRTFNVLDDGNREALGIDVSTSIPSARVIRFMEQLIEAHGKPAPLRLDNGSELTSHAFVEWTDDRGIELRLIAPGKPNQNAFIERFNMTYRTEVLDAYLFASISEVQQITDDWLIEIQRAAATRRPRPGAAAQLSAEGHQTDGVQFLAVSLTGEPTQEDEPTRRCGRLR